MAKKQQQSVKVILTGDEQHTFTAMYKPLELKPGALRFLHLERKGNTVLLLDALDCFHPDAGGYTIPYLRDGEKTTLDMAGKIVEIMVYTVIHLPGELFYHLDELPDGSWRITHSAGLLQSPHESITDFTVLKV
jgi:hypothetical protein